MSLHGSTGSMTPTGRAASTPTGDDSTDTATTAETKPAAGMLAREALGQPPEHLDVPAESPAAAPDGAASPELTPWRFFFLSISITMGLFLAMLDTSIVATSLLAIGRDLGNAELLNWVALAYTLAYLSCAVVFARIADIVGRRNAYLAAAAVFVVFSIGCGCSRTLHQLIALRALQGVGGSGLYSLSMVIWPELCPARFRRSIAGLVGIVIAVAGVLGPVLGGLLTTYASWKWIFWINGPLGVVAMAGFLLAWPDETRLPQIKRKPWSSLDVVGSLLLIAAAALVTFAFQNAGVNPGQWNQAVFLAPLLTGVAAWVALFAWQRAVVQEKPWARHIMPAVPLRLLRHRVDACAMLATLLTGYPFFATLFSLSLRLQIVNGKSSLMAGVLLLPLLGGVSVGSVLCSAINANAGSRNNHRLCETLVGACGLMVLGCALDSTTATLSGDAARLEPKPLLLGVLPLIGLGLGLVVTASTMLAAVGASPQDHAAAQGIVAQMRVLGGSLGIAASSAILAHQEMKRFGTMLSSADVSGTADSGSLTAVLVRQVFARAFAQDMRVCAIVSAVAMVVACGTYQRERAGGR